MNTDRVINTIVDFVNKDISKEATLDVVGNELNTQENYQEGHKEEILSLIEMFDENDKGNMQEFIEKISMLISYSEK